METGPFKGYREINQPFSSCLERSCCPPRPHHQKELETSVGKIRPKPRKPDSQPPPSEALEKRAGGLSGPTPGGA